MTEGTTMTDTTTPVQGLQLGDKTYNKAKFVVQIILPALGVFYATMSELWQFPKVQEVVGTVNAIALFLGIILGISTASYRKTVGATNPVGTFVVTEDVNGKKSVKLDLEEDPEQFIGKGSIVFNVSKEEASAPDDDRE